jgi:PAS domain S-box-containing protein
LKIKLLNRLIHAGTGPQWPDRQNKRTVLLNKFCLSIALLGMPYIFIFYFLNLPTLALVVTPSILIYMTLPALNSIGWFSTSRVIMLVTGNFMIAALSLACGRDCGFSLFFFALMTFPFVAFEYNDVKKILAGVALPVVLFIAVEVASTTLKPVVSLAPSVQLFIYCTLIFSTGFSIILSALYNFVQGEKIILQVIAANKKLQIIFDNANDIIMTIERGSIYSTINHGGRGSAAHVRGKSIYEMLPEKEARRYAAYNDEVFATGKLLQTTDYYTMPDGTAVWHKLTLCPVLDENQNVSRIIGFSRDISEEKVLLEQLTRSKEQAEAANIAKSAFLANMSHEIRTPMASVLGYVDLLDRADLPEEKRSSMIEAVRRNGNYLLSLLTEILDLSKIEAGQLQINVAEVNLQEELRSVTELLRPRAEKKKIALDLEAIDPETKISTDSMRLRQILINIIGNAIKFTERGHVRISVKPDGSLLQIDVTDTGIGIDPSVHRQLFSPFSQADGSIAARFGGTGLGLVISARLAAALGGRVELTHSSPQKGSTFSVYIDPALKGALDVTKTAKGLTPALKGFRLLIVEDNQDVQDLLCDILTYAGADLDRASNGKAAVEKIQNGKFDVVFMDVQMPEMNGYQAVTMLRATGCTTPIVALTAFASTDAQSRCFNAGFTDVLYKPFDKNELIQMALKCLNPNSDQGPVRKIQ